MKKKANNPTVAETIVEMADDMRKLNILSKADHAKITMRHRRKEEIGKIEAISPNEISALRKKARMSQAVFGAHLNLTTGFVSQLERGAKRPTGPALVLLNVIRRKGIEAIL
jgi:putative transcriptional regulator